MDFGRRFKADLRRPASGLPPRFQMGRAEQMLLPRCGIALVIGIVPKAETSARPCAIDSPMALRSAFYSLVLGLVVLFLKGGAYFLTGSVALYSDALESIINVIGAGAALVALGYARKPADEGHPYGHEKAQYFSAVLEGVLIIIAAAAIVLSVVGELRSPKPLESLGIGLAISGAAAAINLLFGVYLVRVGRSLPSPALVADGKHLLSDVVTSAGVLVGLGLAVLTGWRAFDPILALGVAGYILLVGWRLVHSSLNSLLDEAAPPAVQDRINALIRAHAEGAIEAHDFRTRNSGRLMFIEFHLIVPSRMTVEAAHAICDELEAIIERDIPGSDVTIHVEPESKAKHLGIVLKDSEAGGR